MGRKSSKRKKPYFGTKRASVEHELKIIDQFSPAAIERNKTIKDRRDFLLKKLKWMNIHVTKPQKQKKIKFPSKSSRLAIAQAREKARSAKQPTIRYDTFAKYPRDPDGTVVLPSYHPECVRRRKTRKALFAKDKVGSGKPGPSERKLTDKSRIRCEKNTKVPHYLSDSVKADREKKIQQFIRRNK